MCNNFDVCVIILTAGKFAGVAPEAKLVFVDLGKPGTGLCIPPGKYLVFYLFFTLVRCIRLAYRTNDYLSHIELNMFWLHTVLQITCRRSGRAVQAWLPGGCAGEQQQLGQPVRWRRQWRLLRQSGHRPIPIQETGS